MRTNKEKFEYYYNLLQDIFKKFISEQIPELPKKLYSLYCYYNVHEHEITHASYHIDECYFGNDKPTKKDIERIKNVYNDYISGVRKLNKDDIRIHYRYSGGTFRVSGSYKFSAIDGKKISTNLEDLSDEISRMKELYEPREGYNNCTYCRKVYPKDKVVNCKIIFQDTDRFGKKFVNQKTNQYCSEQCGFSDQCAHEG
jgi:methionine synthase II (cobalamin-independent)